MLICFKYTIIALCSYEPTVHGYANNTTRFSIAFCLACMVVDHSRTAVHRECPAVVIAGAHGVELWIRVHTRPVTPFADGDLVNAIHELARKREGEAVLDG